MYVYQESDAAVPDRTVTQFQMEFLRALQSCGFYGTQIQDIEQYCASAFPSNKIGAFFQLKLEQNEHNTGMLPSKYMM
jgi:hypothetical protein